MAGRFDYVKYDEVAAEKQQEMKFRCEAMETAIEELLPASRPKSLALTSLEETYMWIGKGVPRRPDRAQRFG